MALTSAVWAPYVWMKKESEILDYWSWTVNRCMKQRSSHSFSEYYQRKKVLGNSCTQMDFHVFLIPTLTHFSLTKILIFIKWWTNIMSSTCSKCALYRYTFRIKLLKHLFHKLNARNKGFHLKCNLYGSRLHWNTYCEQNMETSWRQTCIGFVLFESWNPSLRSERYLTFVHTSTWSLI